jgi:glycosyltransferase involved in cell wall biosynthesis
MLTIPKHIQYRDHVQTSTPTIGVCGRFVSMKGIDVFLTALAELKKRKVPFKAEIAGNGPEKECYVKMLSEYKMVQDVTLHGWINDRDAFYNALDIFCLPSRKEAFGLVILESMMHSLPMVLSDLPGPREIIAQSECALFVPPEDAMSLANSLERLIKDQELRKKMAHNAFNRGQNYSVERVGPQLHDVLLRVCDDYQRQ